MLVRWLQSPHPANGITVKGQIGADNSEALHLALGGNETVKRIPMVKGHRRQRLKVREPNGEHLDLVQLELLGNKLAERLRQRKLAQAELD